MSALTKAEPLTPEEERVVRDWAEAVTQYAPNAQPYGVEGRTVERPLVKLVATLDAARARILELEREKSAALDRLGESLAAQRTTDEASGARIAELEQERGLLIIELDEGTEASMELKRQRDLQEHLLAGEMRKTTQAISDRVAAEAERDLLAARVEWARKVLQRDQPLMLHVEKALNATDDEVRKWKEARK